MATDFPAGIVGENAATALYRIAQEALANIGRHSHADHATISLSAADGAVVLQIQDDGIGISADQSAAPDSYGVIGMRERLQVLGGSLSVEGEQGFGTVLVARVPLPKGGRLE